jgi:hypothetical protein
VKRRGTKEITLRNGLGTMSTKKSNEIHQDLREIWVEERGEVAGRRKKI